MDLEKKFTRICPECQSIIYHRRKKDANYFKNKGKLCKDCGNKKHGLPKEKFICYTCKKEFMEWRSQVTNLESPFCSKECSYDSNKKSLVGKRFGKLKVIKRERKDRTTFYYCKCDCGKEMKTTHSNLLGGSTESCGCLLLHIRIGERKPINKVMETAVWNYYKRNAKTRNIRWLLTFDKFKNLIKQQCFYCNNPGSNLFKHKYKTGELVTANFNGVDRINNLLDYTDDNCVPCCRTCNGAKSSLSLEEFINWAKQLVSNMQSKI